MQLRTAEVDLYMRDIAVHWFYLIHCRHYRMSPTITEVILHFYGRESKKLYDNFERACPLGKKIDTY